MEPSTMPQTDAATKDECGSKQASPRCALLRAEEALRESEIRYRTLTEILPVGIFRADAAGNCIYVNERWGEIAGLSPEDAMGDGWRKTLHPEDRQRVLATWAEAVANAVRFQAEYRFRRGDGKESWVLGQAVAEKNADGTLVGFVGSITDITAAKKSQQRVEYMAGHDALTGLPNRQLFFDRLAHAIERGERETGKLAVMFLDLDNFKIVNDTLGHYHGDLLLKEVAARVKKILRKKDTLARLGGDEFTIMIEDAWTIAVDTTAQRIIAALSQPIDLAGYEVFVSGSIGISVYPDDGKNITDLLKKADTAMYRAKEQGKNAYRFFEEKMNARAVERLTIETALRRALERNEFFLVYQPQVAIGLGEVTSVEALIRWRHPEHGLISPARFIHVAEDTGLIDPIGEWVLETACRQIRQWERGGLFPPAVSVNLSPRQFRKGDIARNMERILARHNVSPVLVGVELTEGALIEDPKQAVKTMKELKELGIHLSMDDFGTGNSSLSQLRRLPLDELKIDKSFIDEVHHNPDDAAIVSAIVTLGHNLGMIVVAEGVETIEQLNSLHARGCDVVQGHYFSKPLLPDDLRDYLKERRWGRGHW